MLDVLKTAAEEAGPLQAPTRVSMSEKKTEQKPVFRLAYATQVDINYFMRSRAEEFLKFGSRTVAGRTALGARQIVSLPAEQLSYQCYVFRRADGLCSVVIADADYPKQTAFHICNKVLEEFERTNGKEWTTATKDCDGGQPASWLVPLIKDFQNPEKADKLLAVQKKLEEIKGIMQTNIELVLERGENLDSLLDKAQDLQESSKIFFRDAKKVNSCCHRYFGM